MSSSSVVAPVPALTQGPSSSREFGHQIFERDVFGLLGIPLDLVDLSQVIDRVDTARAAAATFVLSTPNLNFLILSRTDVCFRDTLLASDLCPADGIAIVWLSKMLGLPIKERIPGSDIFDALKQRRSGSPIRAFFFGGRDEVAARLALRINSASTGMTCVGAISPGFGTIEQMSSQTFLDQINSSGAELIAIFLNAKKGQEWVSKNAAALRVPLRASLGATINFQIGTVRRAPVLFRATGLEWLWRIKEEPYLWRRYLRDGLSLVRIVATNILPLLILRLLSRIRAEQGVNVNMTHEAGNLTLHIFGAATQANISRLKSVFWQGVTQKMDLFVDLSGVTDADPRFFGLLIVARKILHETGREMHLVNPGAKIKRLFRLHGFGYLFGHRA